MTPSRPLHHVQVARVVEWPDTDAAGHYHHATVARWVEAAEAELHEQLGLDQLFGVIPQVHYEADYHARLWFRDPVTVSLWIDEIGRTSIRYGFQVRTYAEVAAADSMTVVHIDPALGRAVPWPDHVRTSLAAS